LTALLRHINFKIETEEEDPILFPTFAVEF